jgi:uncharacterized OB-fold protein
MWHTIYPEPPLWIEKRYVANYGWECPKCGTVYAPFIQECKNCRKRA